MKKVLIVASSMAYEKMFISLGYDIVYHVEDANLVCFTGGADVNPALYEQTKHVSTHCEPMRDEAEKLYYFEAIKLNIPMVGICRGGQFLHVMNGGSLYQHVDGHATGAPHKLTDVQTGVEHVITSTHHQMMSESLTGAIVAISHEATKLEYMAGSGVELTDVDNDIEVMWYGETRCLCFQPHPEFNNAIEGAATAYSYFKNLLEVYYD